MRQQSEEAKDSSGKATWRLFRRDKGREAHILHFWWLHLTPAQSHNSESFCCTMSGVLETPAFPGHRQNFPSVRPSCLFSAGRHRAGTSCLTPQPWWGGSPPHRHTESSCSNSSEQKQGRKSRFCSFTWKELHYLTGAVPERCPILSSQGINHLPPQTQGSFPTPRGGDETWGTFPKSQVSILMLDYAGGFCLGLS